MPRSVELQGYGFQVADVEMPHVDPKDGQVVFDGKGRPKMQQGKLLVFVDVRSGDQVRVPLSEDARAELVRQLTGGVTIARTVPVPP